MSLGVIGKKLGMTRVFTAEGQAVPVTVIEVSPNRVTRIKSPDSDGYTAVQVTAGTRHRGRINQALAGEFAKAGVEAGRGLWEMRVTNDELGELRQGSEITVSIFQQGQKVDVSGRTIGKGFAGVVKRHGFSMQDATHGNSRSHRAPGSIGQNQSPGKVFKGKRMAGHMGNANRTIQKLEIVVVDGVRNLLLVKGAVPGSRGGDVLVRPACK